MLYLNCVPHSLTRYLLRRNTDWYRFFTRGHPNAPFLDVDLDSDPERVREESTLLFLAILSVGARFWSASSQ